MSSAGIVSLALRGLPSLARTPGGDPGDPVVDRDGCGVTAPVPGDAGALGPLAAAPGSVAGLAGWAAADTGPVVSAAGALQAHVAHAIITAIDTSVRVRSPDSASDRTGIDPV